MKLLTTSPSRADITVELNPVDQDFLLAIMRKIGGSPEESYRYMADDFAKLLSSVGAQRESVFSDTCSGSLKFCEFSVSTI